MSSVSLQKLTSHRMVGWSTIITKTLIPFDSNSCSKCNTQLNITHVLNECVAYRNSRVKIFEPHSHFCNDGLNWERLQSISLPSIPNIVRFTAWLKSCTEFQDKFIWKTIKHGGDSLMISTAEVRKIQPFVFLKCSIITSKGNVTKDT